MLTRFIKIQLIVFTILTLIALTALGWYYLRLPAVAGIGQYTLYAELPRSGGLYSTANVTYRGTQIGKVRSRPFRCRTPRWTWCCPIAC